MSKGHTLAANKELITDRATITVIGVLFFILATTLGAYVRIPLKGNPVPITLQTFFVVLSGAVLGKRLGSYSQIGYIMLGALGLPVFQGYSFGMSYILGPTGGYLIGFVLAAWLIGRTKCSILSFIAVDLIIHFSGAFWLIYLYKINIATGMSIGILPFIPGEIVKMSLAAIIYSRISQRFKSIFSV